MARKRLSRIVAGVCALAMLAVIALSFPGCGARDDGWDKNHAGPKVVVSFAPLACFALNVAGEDAVVRPCPSG